MERSAEKREKNELKTVDGKFSSFLSSWKIPSHSQITKCVVKRNGKTVYCRRSNEVRRGRFLEVFGDYVTEKLFVGDSFNIFSIFCKFF
jgi:hypothetical protein